jgi:hypothetical protein
MFMAKVNRSIVADIEPAKENKKCNCAADKETGRKKGIPAKKSPINLPDFTGEKCDECYIVLNYKKKPLNAA